jgi:hypothetical protein
MAEQQLIDYIKKARQAGQQDSQNKNLLIKNGWTEVEINEAFLALDQLQSKPEPMPQIQEQVQSQAQPQFQPQHQVSGQAEIKTQPDKGAERTLTSSDNEKRTLAQPIENPMSQSQQYQPQETKSNMPRSRGGTFLILKLLIIFILLAIIGVAIYFVIMQQGFLKDAFKNVWPFSIETTQTPVVPNQTPADETTQKTLTSINLETNNIIVVPQEYDATKIAVVAFNEAGDEAVYCVPQKINYQISCFLNGQKLFDNQYSYKPYWIGFSPNNQRIIFLYYDSVKKQSFIFENMEEKERYAGIITSPMFSSDSQNFVFMVIGNDGKNFVVLDDKASAPHDKIYTIPKFTSDGRYLLYGVRDGQNILWVADETVKIGVLPDEATINEVE